MKDILRQLTVVVTVVITLIVNTLANALPINGQSTASISDRFQVYFVPAGYVFSIWGIIYIGLIAYTIFQALPSQRQNPRMRATGWWVVLSGIANSSWIFLWHYNQFPLTIVVMLVLLAALVMIYLGLRPAGVKVSKAESWAARVPFSIYLGWITVATIANATDVLDYLKWDRFGIAPETWMVILLAAVLGITALVNFTRRDIAYTLVILWALAGISAKQAAFTAVTTPTWITFGLVAATLAGAFMLSRTSGQKVSSLAL